MKKIFIIILTLFSTLLFSYEKMKLKAVVLWVYDGDTIKIRLRNGRKYKIRFWGVDAPENSTYRFGYKQRYGRRAMLYVKRKIKGKTILLVTYQRRGKVLKDKFGRILAYVYYKGKCLFKELLLKGLVKVYRGKLCTRYDEFVRYEKKARIRKKGIWSLR